MKNKTQVRRKIFEHCISEKSFVFGIYDELALTDRETKNQLKLGKIFE